MYACVCVFMDACMHVFEAFMHIPTTHINLPYGLDLLDSQSPFSSLKTTYSVWDTLSRWGFGWGERSVNVLWNEALGFH
jgi:hypothetical protein